MIGLVFCMIIREIDLLLEKTLSEWFFRYVETLSAIIILRLMFGLYYTYTILYRNPVLDGPRGDSGDRLRLRCRHLEPRHHRPRDGRGEASLRRYSSNEVRLKYFNN